MKKLIWISLSIFLFLSGISYAEAQTTLNPKEASNGKVNLNLTFDTGYVGGIELKAKLSGNVEVTDFTWNLALRNFTKRYSFDKNTKTLTLYIATGSNVKNLLDVNKEVVLGTVVLKDSKTQEEYSIQLDSLSYVKANYNTEVGKDLETTANTFVLKKTDSSNTNTNSNKPSNSNSNSNSNVVSNSNSNSSTNVSNTNTNTSSNTGTNSNSNSGSNTNSMSNSSTNGTTNSSTNSSSNIQTEKTEDKNDFPFIYVAIAVVVLALIGIIALIVQRKRRA